MSRLTGQTLQAKKRGKARKWVPTPEIDAVIRRLYAERVGRNRYIAHQKAGIVRVGVKNDAGFGGSSWFDVK